ncbi:phosphatase/nucleotidase [Neocallimastix sp. 'constans']|jgi:2',3'-cyclic-nucleotide 2'-phosphodiesterase/3'-nucleotidase
MKLYNTFVLLLAASSGYARIIKKCMKKDPNFSYTKSGDIVISEPIDRNNVTITIAATSDMHGRIYPWEYAIDEADNDAGFALTDTVVSKIKEDYPNTLLMDVGDLLQGNSAELFIKYYTHPTVQALNLLKYDVWIPGNHEFNYGLSFLQRNLKHFNGRVVCSNIKYADSLKYYLLPYQIYSISGVRVAIVGATAPHIKQWEASNPDHFKNLEFLDPIESLKTTIKAIKGKYDILVGAVHISRNGEYEAEGKTGAFQIAEAIPEFDVIIAGHEHATYCDKINDTWVLEPGHYGSHVAFTKFDLVKENDHWKIVNIEAENIGTNGVTPSQRVMEKFKWVHEQSLADANEIVGKVDADFIEGVDYITSKSKVTTMPRAQIEDTALMDLINEVQTYYAKSEISTAALFNNNQNLKAGDFKRKDVAFIYKYDNTLMGINIKGENLLKYMEWTVGYYQTVKEGDVTIAFNPDFRSYNYDMLSGIQYEIDLSEPEGRRIKNVTFNGKKIDPNATYKLALNNYRFGTLTSNGWATEADVYYSSVNDPKPTIRDFIAKYTQEVLGGTISPKCDHNWKIVGLPKSFNDPATIAKIKSGEIKIPRSSDGRTPNVEPVRKI